MSSPDRAKTGAKTGAGPVAKPGAAATKKAPPAKVAAVKAPPKASAKPATPAKPAKAKAPAPAATKTQDASPQQKAAFLRAMAKGVTPNSAASRKLEEKKGSPFAPATAAKSASKPAQKVELLRRIPAPAAIVNTPESEAALQLVATIERMLAAEELGKIQPHAQQALIAALCKLYAANAEAGERYAILGGRTLVTATDVMVVCGALLKAVDLQVFELGMWQSWSTS